MRDECPVHTSWAELILMCHLGQDSDRPPLCYPPLRNSHTPALTVSVAWN